MTGDRGFRVSRTRMVTLSAYEIGKFEATKQQVCDVHNWTGGQGYFTTVNAGTCAAFGQELLDLDSSSKAGLSFLSEYS